MSLINRLLEEMNKEPEAAKKLAKRLAAGIASDESLRSLLLEALLREAATKDDIARLEQRLGERIDRLEERMDSLIKWIIGLLVTIWGTIAVIGLAVLRVLAH